MMDHSGEQTALLAAQPIYDRALCLHALELLYRNDAMQSAVDIGERRATSELIFNLCAGITDHAEQFDRPVFINASADFLLSQAFLPIDPEIVVIELVERLEPTRELVEAVRGWHRKGFRFALDDFEFSPAWDVLLPLASVIKVDVLGIGFEAACRHRERLAHHRLQWLAERIETGDDYQRYHDAGFDLFQGYFLAHPRILRGHRLDPGILQLARLISALFGDEPDIDQLAATISHDPALALSLIRLVNSPAYRGRRHIDSMRDVILRLGLDRLRRWVMLLATLDAGSPEPARVVLVRAEVCAKLCERAGARSEIRPAEAFLVGLLSGVDVLLGIDRGAFMMRLEVPARVTEAVRQGVGPAGAWLAEVTALERAMAMKSGVEQFPRTLVALYRESVMDVQNICRQAGADRGGAG